MKYSYHNHTYLCNHAFGEPEDYVKEAVAAGLDFFGFSCHAPHLFKGGYESPIRMLPTDLDLYANKVLSLRHKYRDYINIGLGLEYDYYRPSCGRDVEFYKSAGVEYLILGQHFTDDESLPSSYNSYHPTNSRAGLSAYTDSVIEALGTGLISYIAHPDCFYFTGDEKFYISEADRLIRAAMSHGVPLEVNVFGHSRARHYPSRRFFERVAALGADTVLGIDAHTKERVYSESEIRATLDFCEALGIAPMDKVTLRKIV